MDTRVEEIEVKVTLEVTLRLTEGSVGLGVVDALTNEFGDELRDNPQVKAFTLQVALPDRQLTITKEEK